MKVKKGKNKNLAAKKLNLNIAKINKLIKKYELNFNMFEIKQAADLINHNNFLSRIGLDEDPYKAALEQSKNYYAFIYYILEMIRTGILEVDYEGN